MNAIDQLQEDCRLLYERSRTLHERIQQEYASSAEQTAQFAELYQRCHDAQAAAAQLRRLVTDRRASEEPGERGRGDD